MTKPTTCDKNKRKHMTRGKPCHQDMGKQKKKGKVPMMATHRHIVDDDDVYNGERVVGLNKTPY